MASATLPLKNHTLGDVNLTSPTDTLALNALTPRGAIYKSTSRALSKPYSVTFDNQVGVPGAKGNDKLNVIVSLTDVNSSTNLSYTGQAKMTLSIPRDGNWTVAMTQDLIANLASVIGVAANRVAIATGAVA